ncbi:hypothetical protein [Oryza sativa Japonica Group]|uniref:Uncharacterized protein n=1 Tax=Oryza sativa subsp. japonica TaxID=39947 RepID=Q942I3_ORYSJ|nr:hypothetical protein [Oryza sativa Japonica Group]
MNAYLLLPLPPPATGLFARVCKWKDVALASSAAPHHRLPPQPPPRRLASPPRSPLRRLASSAPAARLAAALASPPPPPRSPLLRPRRACLSFAPATLQRHRLAAASSAALAASAVAVRRRRRAESETVRDRRDRREIETDRFDHLAYPTVEMALIPTCNARKFTSNFRTNLCIKSSSRNQPSLLEYFRRTHEPSKRRKRQANTQNEEKD